MIGFAQAGTVLGSATYSISPSFMWRSFSAWKEHAAPKSKRHGKEGRSAQEMAPAWIGCKSPELPPEVERLLRSHPGLYVGKAVRTVRS